MSMLEAIDRGIEKIKGSMTNDGTMHGYMSALSLFRRWFTETGQVAFNEDVIRSHLSNLKNNDASASNINFRISAIAKLAKVLAAHGDLSGGDAYAISTIHREIPVAAIPSRALSPDEAKQLLESPNQSTRKGTRDRAILAVMLGSGLNPFECANLTVAHLGENSIIGIRGSGDRNRDSLMPDWVKAAISAHLSASNIVTGPVFRSMRRGDSIQSKAIPYTSIHDLINHYAKQVGIDVNSRDLTLTAVSLSEQESADYQARIVELERESASLRRALNIKANLPHEQLKKAIVQYGE
jgi:site-specific recombinase XerD